MFCFSVGSAAADTFGCIRRSFGKSSFVCVCNANYCDSAPTLASSLAPGHATLISSSKDSARFKITNLTFTDLSNSVLGNSDGSQKNNFFYRTDISFFKEMKYLLIARFKLKKFGDLVVLLQVKFFGFGVAYNYRP